MNGGFCNLDIHEGFVFLNSSGIDAFFLCVNIGQFIWCRPKGAVCD